MQSAISAPFLARAGEINRNLTVVVTGGHPGDPEYGCGGTIARYAELGHDITLVYLNRGGKGCAGKNPDECSATRVAEARKACHILGARDAYAGQLDGEAVVDFARYEQFRKLLDFGKVDVLFTHWPIDAHPDHRAISMLAYDAWLRSGKKSAFYYYEVSNGEDTQMFSPTDYVDISKMEPKKREACYAHASQSPDRFYALQHQVTSFRGIESGYSQAEAFIRHIESPPGFLPSS
ncbi:MAG: PIG-L family deacetylase [Bryobacteraceae bacterium]